MTPVLHVDFGAPAAAAANAISLTQALLAATLTGALLNGAVGAAAIPTPRNIVAAWTGAAILTVTGTDQYGRVIRESSASGTSLAGKKAFKTVTLITTNADITGLTVGTGDVLGLPVAVGANGLIDARANNAIDAGTFVPRDIATATAVTGDVRGTFDPAVALNGTNTVAVTVVIADPSGVNGTYGVPQFGG
jgi:hypothetical protein